MKSMSKLQVFKVLSAVSVLLIFVLFVLRQAFGLNDSLASTLMLLAVLVAIISLTCLGVVGYKQSARQRQGEDVNEDVN